MSARRQALAILANVGADVIDNSRPGGLDIDAWCPSGRVWSATGCHTLVVCFHTDRPAGWRALLHDLRLGTEPCRTKNCEGCKEE